MTNYFRPNGLRNIAAKNASHRLPTQLNPQQIVTIQLNPKSVTVPYHHNSPYRLRHRFEPGSEVQGHEVTSEGHSLCFIVAQNSAEGSLRLLWLQGTYDLGHHKIPHKIKARIRDDLNARYSMKGPHQTGLGPYQL